MYVRSFAVSPAQSGSGANLFASTSGGGVFLTTDYGATWTDVNANLTNYQVRTLAVIGGNIFAGTSSGPVWRRSIAEMVTAVRNETASTPSQFELRQNYPNPFNPVTTIVYQVAGSREYEVGSRKKTDALGHVKLAVYDLLGREVAVLVDGYQTPGGHRVTFDARKLASGVYFYRLVAGGSVQTRKMTLLR